MCGRLKRERQMAGQTPKRRRSRFIRLVNAILGVPNGDADPTDPPTLHEQLEDLFATVADQESRWHRRLGSRRR